MSDANYGSLRRSTKRFRNPLRRISQPILPRKIFFCGTISLMGRQTRRTMEASIWVFSVSYRGYWTDLFRDTEVSAGIPVQTSSSDYDNAFRYPPHGKLPAILNNTNFQGRFQTNTRLCFSFSDFHPKEWNPSWQVSTILVGLLSFMVPPPAFHQDKLPNL